MFRFITLYFKYRTGFRENEGVIIEILFGTTGVRSSRRQARNKYYGEVTGSRCNIIWAKHENALYTVCDMYIGVDSELW